MIWNAERVIEQYEQRIKDLHREMEALKMAHASQVQYVISEHEKLQQEYGRLLRVMHPSVQSVELPGEAKKEEPKEKVPVFGGSRWEQFKAQKIWEQEQAAKAANEHRESAVEEKSHGSL